MTTEAGSESRTPAGLRNYAPAAMIGAIAGIDNVASCLAVASLIFTGSLAAGLGLGVSVMLLGGGILALVVALRSSQPNSIALVQETSIAILAAAVMSMAAQLVAPAEVKIATALAILGTASVVTGALFWLAGWLRLGVLARFLPFPVVAGFLAGSGWLLVAGAMFVATGGSDIRELLGSLRDPDVLWRLIPTVAFAGVHGAGGQALRRWCDGPHRDAGGRCRLLRGAWRFSALTSRRRARTVTCHSCRMPAGLRSQGRSFCRTSIGRACCRLHPASSRLPPSA